MSSFAFIDHPLVAVAALATAYAAGCLNVGYYLVRWRRGADIRNLGSGNAGATNAGRVLGPSGYATVLAGDMAKGGLAVVLVQAAGLSAPFQAAAVVLAVAGHNFPAQLGFRGGKGIAASAGALLFFDPRLFLPLLGTCSLLALATRRLTVSACFGYLILPALAWVVGYDFLVVVGLVVLAGLVIVPQRRDLRREFVRRRPVAGVRYKIASEPWEFEAIHRLNYQTFVEEIPQHPPRPERKLVDRFHAENHYLIALQGRELAGMVALRGQRPFSLDAKIPDLDRYLPPEARTIEVRLLAISPRFRNTNVFAELLCRVASHCAARGFDAAVVSATTRQLKLYRHLGFEPFGGLVGTPAARFQPMLLTLQTFTRVATRSRRLRRPIEQSWRRSSPMSFLPGPVTTRPEVDSAFRQPAVSHRSATFTAELGSLRSSLCTLTRARQVQVIPGSGTLGNTIVATQLRALGTPGVIVSNGEFGERLVAEAGRLELEFRAIRLSPGTPFDLADIAIRTAALPHGGWIWCVHHETSTGMLNPLEELSTIARAQRLRLCVDCISSIGATEIDLSDVTYATGTSGKALGGYPGLALVFHREPPQPAPRLTPGYLDLQHWARHDSIPHTHSSNLVRALAAALPAITPERFASIRAQTVWLTGELQRRGLPTLPGAVAGVVTIALRQPVNAFRIGQALAGAGFLTHFESPHLRRQNWLQIALFAEPPRPTVVALLETLTELLRPESLDRIPRLLSSDRHAVALACAPTV